MQEVYKIINNYTFYKILILMMIDVSYLSRQEILKRKLVK